MNEHQEEQAAFSASRRGFLGLGLLAAISGAIPWKIGLPGTVSRTLAPDQVLQVVAGQLGASIRAPTVLPPLYMYTGMYRPTVQGFQGSPTQTALVYRSPIEEQPRRKLTAFLAIAPFSHFMNTRGRRSDPVHVKTSVADAVAEYWPGSWRSGPGTDQITLPKGFRIHWDQSDLHSLVLNAPGWGLALHGSRKAGVSKEALVNMMDSMFV